MSAGFATWFGLLNMFARLARLSIVLLVFSSLAVKEVQARHQAALAPSSKARYYPLARDYRQKIQEKIEGPSRVSESLPLFPFAQLSPSSFGHEDERIGRLPSGSDPSDLLMSLQP